MRLPGLHLVTDDRTLADAGFSHGARAALEEGGGRVALHLRGPRTDARRLHDLAVELGPPAADVGAWLVLNDRIGVAGALDLDRVHLGQRSLPVEVVRRLLRPGVAVSVSVHDPDEARSAAAADWLMVGSLYVTPSHPHRPAGGLGLLGAVGAVSSLPLVAIGGVTPDRAADLRRAGADGVAVVSGVWGRADPAGAVADYLAAWHDQVGPNGDGRDAA